MKKKKGRERGEKKEKGEKGRGGKKEKGRGEKTRGKTKHFHGKIEPRFMDQRQFV